MKKIFLTLLKRTMFYAIFIVLIYSIYFYIVDAKYSSKSVAAEMFMPYSMFHEISEIEVSNALSIQENSEKFIDYKITINKDIVVLRNEKFNVTMVIVPEIVKTKAGGIKSYKCYGFPASEMRIAKCENYVNKKI